MHNYVVRKVSTTDIALTPGHYGSWMEKEINEQYDASIRAMGMGSRLLNDNMVKLGGLETHTEMLKTMDHLILLGCGTSYNAGLMSLNILKKISGFCTVHIFDGAEFTWDDVPRKGKSVLLFMSQSGETKDLYRCIPIAKEMGLFTIGIINVVDSLIARNVNCGVYLNAGREVAVASTKSFTSQVITLHMLAVWFSQNRGIYESVRYDIIKGLRNLPHEIKSVISNTNNDCIKIAKTLLPHNNMFILGKHNCYSTALEGSLKIKEVG